MVLLMKAPESRLRKSTCDNGQRSACVDNMVLLQMADFGYELTFHGARISRSSITFPPGGPMPSLNVTVLFMKLSDSSKTSQADMAAMKSSGLRHLIRITSQSSPCVSFGLASDGLTG